MATDGSPRVKDRGNSCSLCLEPYGDERKPKMLPCFHTFCIVCLKLLEASVTKATPDNGPEDNRQAAEDKDTTAEPDTGSESAEGTDITDDVITGSADASNPPFLCPTCRVHVHLPEGGVAALQANFYLSYDVAMCDACPEGSQQRADVFCHDCDKYLCPTCRRNHEGHATSDIASAVVQAKSELPSLRTEAQKQLHIVQTTIRHTERQKRHLSRLAHNVTRQINPYDVPEVSAVPATACMGRVVEVGADDVIKPLSMAELADKLDRLENDVTETKAEVTKTKAEFTQTKGDVSQNKADLSQTKAEVVQNTAQINAISTSVKELADKIDKASTRVSFHALRIDKTRTKLGQPIVFEEVTVNEGGGYQRDTGVFTAPVAGTYIVSAGVMKAGQSGSLEAYIMVDKAAHGRFVGSSTSSATRSSALSLSKGQTVWVETGSKVDDYANDLFSACYFTGALVQPKL